jgi:hypothetical protein
MILFLLLCGSDILYSQNAYNDANFLAPQLAPRNFTDGKIPLNKTVKDLLSKYYGPLPAFADQAAVDLYFSGNPFFRKANDPSKSILQFGAALGVIPYSGILSSLGNLDVTNLADGFGKFLVKRTKEELSVAFFNRFKELINKDEYKDAVILFPQTCSVLDAIGDQIYNYQAYINSLREAFEKDLSGLLPNLRKVINDGRYSGYFTGHPELKSGILSALYIANGLYNKDHPGKILAEFNAGDLDGFNGVSVDIKASVQTLQLFSESLRSRQTGHYWVPADSIRLLVNDPIALQLYLGFVWKQADGILFSNGTLASALERLVTAGNNISSFNDYMTGLIQNVKTVSTAVDNITGKKSSDLTFTDYYQLYSSSLDLFDYGLQVTKIPALSTLRFPDAWATYISMARSAGNIALDINRRNYSSAIVNTYNLYKSAFIQNGEANTKFEAFILKYGAFAAAVAQAQNSDDVESAIEAIALPSGSSLVKRETLFNVAVNAYAGLYYGHEAIQGIKDGLAFNSYGVTAPVGFTLSRGHSIFFLGGGKKRWDEGKGGWSSSLFVSLIDLGAVAAFRLKDDTTAQVPTIQLKNIFSPGAFISIGIPKSPISVNMGAQMGPNLRKVYGQDGSHSANDYENKVYWRYSISVCVDVPLLNLYSLSR